MASEQQRSDRHRPRTPIWVSSEYRDLLGKLAKQHKQTVAEEAMDAIDRHAQSNGLEPPSRPKIGRPPKAGRPWTAEEDELLRTLSPAEVAQRTGRTLTAVYSRRKLLGLEDGRRKFRG